MKTTDERIRAKFENLIKEGQMIMSSCGWNGHEYSRWPSEVEYQRFRSQVMNLIERVSGRKSSHFEMIKNLAEQRDSMFNPYFFKDCFGMLEGAYQDYLDGFLIDIRHVIRAELLDDFLSQSEELLVQGFHIAAASLAGAVLEDTLRKLCDKHSISYPTKTNINSLNTELARAETYDKLVQKEITAKADLRNSADHGQFDKVKESDVEDMVRWVRRFVAEYLT